MQSVTTNAGAIIKVEDGTEDSIIAILKAAPTLLFTEFVYTGNSPNGENRGNYDDLETWLRSSGLDIEPDDGIHENDISIVIWNLEKTTGTARIIHNGKTLTYHVQARNGEGHMDMGYTWRAEYRKIACV